jgi:hypothetical protein
LFTLRGEDFSTSRRGFKRLSLSMFPSGNHSL